MLFLFNDVVLEIGQPLELIHSDEFPMSAGAFARMQLQEITILACEEVFADMDMPHNKPDIARHLSVLIAAKSGASAVLIGPPVGGARKASEFGVRLAEVSLMTMSHLYQMQEGGTLTPQLVHQAVWQSLQS